MAKIRKHNIEDVGEKLEGAKKYKVARIPSIQELREANVKTLTELVTVSNFIPTLSKEEFLNPDINRSPLIELAKKSILKNLVKVYPAKSKKFDLCLKAENIPHEEQETFVKEYWVQRTSYIATGLKRYAELLESEENIVKRKESFFRDMFELYKSEEMSHYRLMNERECKIVNFAAFSSKNYETFYLPEIENYEGETLSEKARNFCKAENFENAFFFLFETVNKNSYTPTYKTEVLNVILEPKRLMAIAIEEIDKKQNKAKAMVENIDIIQAQRLLRSSLLSSIDNVTTKKFLENTREFSHFMISLTPEEINKKAKEVAQGQGVLNISLVEDNSPSYSLALKKIRSRFEIMRNYGLLSIDGKKLIDNQSIPEFSQAREWEEQFCIKGLSVEARESLQYFFRKSLETKWDGGKEDVEKVMNRYFLSAVLANANLITTNYLASEKFIEDINFYATGFRNKEAYEKALQKKEEAKNQKNNNEEIVKTDDVIVIAETILDKNKDTIEILFKEYQKEVRGNANQADYPEVASVRREGVNFRKDKSIDNEKFPELFGVLNVEYGEGLNDKQREVFTNLIADGLYDMAMLLNIDPVKLGEYFTESITMASRGSGNKIAHYDPAQHLIHLTRKRGAGSMAHELGHAFDATLGIQNFTGVREVYSELPSKALNNILFNQVIEGMKYGNQGKSIVEINREQAFESKVEELENQFFKKCEILIKHLTINEFSKIYQNCLDFYETKKDIFENVFENNVERYFGKNGRKITPESYFHTASAMFLTSYLSAKLRHKEISDEKEFLQSQYRYITEKTSLKSSKFNPYAIRVAIHSILGTVLEYKALEKLSENFEKAVQRNYISLNENASIKSQLFKDSIAYDKMMKKSYYSTNPEMFARSFQEYIAYKMKENGIRNEFLERRIKQEFEGRMIYQFDFNQGNFIPREVSVFPRGKELEKFVSNMDRLIANTFEQNPTLYSKEAYLAQGYDIISTHTLVDKSKPVETIEKQSLTKKVGSELLLQEEKRQKGQEISNKGYKIEEQSLLDDSKKIQRTVLSKSSQMGFEF